MAINLAKSGAVQMEKTMTINLRKPLQGSGHVNENSQSEFDLSQVTVGLGWDENKGFLGLGGNDVDMDLVCFLLNENGKLESKDDIVYFGNKNHKSSCVNLDKDDLTGGSAKSGEPDENMQMKLNSLPAKYTRAVISSSIYGGKGRGQNFGKIKTAFVNVRDKSNREIARYDISSNEAIKNAHSFVFCELFRENDEWKMRIIDKALDTDQISEVAAAYK